ncbi:creatininase family protein [Microbacterium sulfonylureivorans]|uniref:creatininase family protein n=1 Tax=Microbacterium sulfonylureivorans TaxID=2486854 RepID=UPI000FDC5321|nr:creatininase family protein [Microbacterium sulfonylureivorans]
MKLINSRSDQAASGPGMVALLPMGAVEQHSLHLPLGTDTLIVEAIAAAVERRLPTRVVLLPTLSVGASDHHLAMPGTISIGTQTAADHATHQCLSLAQSTGIRTFVLLNGHGGNQPACRLALEKLRAAAPGVRGFAVDYWGPMFDELDASGTARPAAMGHADAIETSILLATHPALVDMDRAVEDGYQDALPAYVTTTEGIPERTRHGGVGDPRRATATDGERYFGAAVEGIVTLIGTIVGASDSPQKERNGVDDSH